MSLEAFLVPPVVPEPVARGRSHTPTVRTRGVSPDGPSIRTALTDPRSGPIGRAGDASRIAAGAGTGAAARRSSSAPARAQARRSVGDSSWPAVTRGRGRAGEGRAGPEPIHPAGLDRGARGTGPAGPRMTGRPEKTKING